MQVMAWIAGILGDLEAAIRHELGADQIKPKTGSELLDMRRSRSPRAPEARGSSLGVARATRNEDAASALAAAGGYCLIGFGSGIAQARRRCAKVRRYADFRLVVAIADDRDQATTCQVTAR